MRELASAGVSSIMLSWWGQAAKEVRRDSQGVSTDELVPAVLDAAAAAGVGVTWHIEPYGGRSPDSVLDDLQYLHARYGAHPGVWRQPVGEGGATRMLPVVFLYDVSAEHSGNPTEQRVAREAWRRVKGRIRGTEADAVLLSLFVDKRDVDFVVDADLDGAYTYFAARGFTEGSTPANWMQLHQRMAAAGRRFVPSVGPGYNDTLIRPWNGAATRDREKGAYYDGMWRSALDTSTNMVTITSFNEWGEGTQIEAARPHVTGNGSAYADYAPDPANFYMERTREWVQRARRERGCDEPRSQTEHVEL